MRIIQQYQKRMKVFTSSAEIFCRAMEFSNSQICRNSLARIWISATRSVSTFARCKLSQLICQKISNALSIKLSLSLPINLCYNRLKLKWLGLKITHNYAHCSNKYTVNFFLLWEANFVGIELFFLAGYNFFGGLL